jgi:hypothetical protein
MAAGDTDRLDRIESLLKHLGRRFRRLEGRITALDGRIAALENRPLPPINIYTGGQNGAASSGEQARHSPDFRTAHWFGRDYRFTTAQALVVKRLWQAWEADEGEVGLADLLTAAESDSDRLDNLFRDGQGRMHPAWEFMIARSRRGFFRLERPGR